MKIAKSKIPRQPPQIRRIPPQMRKRLDQLSQQDPPRQRPQDLIGPSRKPRRPRQRIHHRGVVEEGEVDETREEDGVHAPRPAPPHDQAGRRAEQAGGVAAPGGARPAQRLAEEARVGAERGLDEAVGGVLDLDAPPPPDLPAGDEVVVVGVEGAEEAEEEALAREGGEKVRVLQNARAVRGGAARDDEDAAVERVGGADLEVVPLQVQGADQVPKAGGAEEAGGVAADALVRADDADAGVLEGREDAREEVERGPEDVVVYQDGDGGADVGEGMGDLVAFVGYVS